MVKLGFIVEGATEKIILESSDFFTYLESLPVEYVKDVIDAEGNGNLLPHNIVEHSQVLEDKGATKIVVLTDLDNDQCVTNTKNRIQPLENHIVIVSIKAIESWFLSDIATMSNFLSDPDFTFQNPEAVNNPYEELRSLRIDKVGRGFGSKVILANLMIRHKFSIQNAAKHPQCNSARYFLNKISELSEEA